MSKLLLVAAVLVAPILASNLQTRVVGYIPDYRTEILSSLDYSALTHVIAAFINPDAQGHFTPSWSLKSIVSHAKAKKVTVFVAIGGGGANIPVWKKQMSAQNAKATAQKLVASVLSIGAHGIDVDLEGDLVTGGSYNQFVATLASVAKAHNLGLSAALAKWTCSQAITDETLSHFDFINMMAYDYKGPWDTSPPLSDFSSYAVAKTELDYYTHTRNISGSKLTLGLPFYGYDFTNKKNVLAFTWAQLVQSNPGQIDNDHVGGKYYNGRKTIRAKTALAKSLGAGVMIWELGQDVHSGKNSLLQQIKIANTIAIV